MTEEKVNKWLVTIVAILVVSNVVLVVGLSKGSTTNIFGQTTASSPISKTVNYTHNAYNNTTVIKYSNSTKNGTVYYYNTTVYKNNTYYYNSTKVIYETNNNTTYPHTWIEGVIMIYSNVPYCDSPSDVGAGGTYLRGVYTNVGTLVSKTQYDMSFIVIGSSSGNCAISSITGITQGFSLISSTLPFSVDSNSFGILSIDVSVPSTQFAGYLEIEVSS
jgi:hypothetical protein